MKRHLFFAALLLLQLSCFSPKQEEAKVLHDEPTEFSVKNFVGSTVAFESAGAIELGVSKGELLRSFNDYSSKMELGLKAQSVQVVEIEGEHYMRFLNEDGTATTIGLIKGNQLTETTGSSIYQLGQTICTSTPTTSGNACVPRGLYCTGGEVSDCVRTTVGESIAGLSE